MIGNIQKSNNTYHPVFLFGTPIEYLVRIVIVQLTLRKKKLLPMREKMPMLLFGSKQIGILKWKQELHHGSLDFQ